MKKSKKNEELQSRREFFKSAAKGALPILAFTLLGTTVLTSCKKDEDGCGKGCSGGCGSTCSGSCEHDCQTVCEAWCSFSSHDM